MPRQRQQHPLLSQPYVVISSTLAVRSFHASCPRALINSCPDLVVLASDAYDCLTSVPFNPAVATRFLKYYNDTLQFQSNTVFIKNPPASYQQPSSDLFKGLDKIQKDIDTGVFPNQYAFEATLQQLIYSAHDSHLSLNAGILSAFTFASVYGIVSVSSDGQQVPKVYVTGTMMYVNGGFSS